MREILCLLSSQVPLSSFLEEILKFVEVHELFLKHNWLHDIKLGDKTALQRSLEVVCFHALWSMLNENVIFHRQQKPNK